MRPFPCSVHSVLLTCSLLAVALLGTACSGGGGGGSGPAGEAAAAPRMVAGGVIARGAVEQWPAGWEVLLEEDLEVSGSLMIDPGTKVLISDGVGAGQTVVQSGFESSAHLASMAGPGRKKRERGPGGVLQRKESVWRLVTGTRPMIRAGWRGRRR